MVRVRFLSYFAKITRNKIIVLPEKIQTVSEALDYLSKLFSDLEELQDFHNLEVSIIVDGLAVQIPKGLDYIIRDELIIGPIVAGG